MRVGYSHNNVTADRMREHLQVTHPESFSIPGETEIKQFINKMSEKLKRTQSALLGNKSTRGRKLGNTKVTWHTKLKQKLEQNSKEKPRIIYDEFIQNYNGKFPSDLPMKSDGNPHDTQIKQALQRIKQSIELKVQKDVLM